MCCLCPVRCLRAVIQLQLQLHAPAKVRPEAMSSQARQIRHKPTPAGAFSDLGSVVSQQQRARHQASLERKQQQNARVPSVKPARSESARDTHPHPPYAYLRRGWGALAPHHGTPRREAETGDVVKRPPTTQRVRSNLQIRRGTPICRCMHACMHACQPVSLSQSRRSAAPCSVARRPRSITHSPAQRR